jgi:hypothetical protein
MCTAIYKETEMAGLADNNRYGTQCTVQYRTNTSSPRNQTHGPWAVAGCVLPIHFTWPSHQSYAVQNVPQLKSKKRLSITRTYTYQYM